MRRNTRRGFTLLEVLVATTIMAVAVGTLLSALSTSLLNASRVTESDRAAVLAKRIMDELLVTNPFPDSGLIERRFDRRQINLDGGWRARREAFRRVGSHPLDRIVLEIWWMNGEQRRSYLLEAYSPGGQRPRGPQ